jgi:hypothetical protein
MSTFNLNFFLGGVRGKTEGMGKRPRRGWGGNALVYRISKGDSGQAVSKFGKPLKRFNPQRQRTITLLKQGVNEKRGGGEESFDACGSNQSQF